MFPATFSPVLKVLLKAKNKDCRVMYLGIVSTTLFSLWTSLCQQSLKVSPISGQCSHFVPVKNVWTSDVFRWYGKRTLTWNKSTYEHSLNVLLNNHEWKRTFLLTLELHFSIVNNFNFFQEKLTFFLQINWKQKHFN